MPAVPIQTVTAPGVVDLQPNGAGTTLILDPDDTGLYLGFSGAYSGLTFQLQGLRASGIPYDIALYTSDDVGPLAGPVAPADGASILYTADVRRFTQLQLTILTLTGKVVVDAQSSRFFSQRMTATLSGALAQLIYETRAVRATLAGWLGLPAGPLPNLPPASLGTGVGKSFSN